MPMVSVFLSSKNNNCWCNLRYPDTLNTLLMLMLSSFKVAPRESIVRMKISLFGLFLCLLRLWGCLSLWHKWLNLGNMNWCIQVMNAVL